MMSAPKKYINEKKMDKWVEGDGSTCDKLKW